ncbi:MAG: DJ-1/PfpI family protein [Eubacteriales bacterium]|nr:DJ-1/PfpI family protein [Eubacteriales bacterium]
MSKKAVVFLADGFEECEGLIVVDLLRRAGVEVTTASVMGRETVVSSHNITLDADMLCEDVDFSDKDMIVLPGGMPGTKNLGESEVVVRELKSFADKKLIGAICAAPSVPGSLGLLKGKRATCYPGFEDMLIGAEATRDGVVVDGKFITGQALGSAIPFALTLIRELIDAETADKVATSIYFG